MIRLASHIVFVTVFTFISQVLFGQNLSNLGRFEVDFIKGCAPLTINLTSNISCPCDIRFGDGNSGQDIFTHTYTQPGTYFLEIDYQSLNPRTDVIEITVEENLPPSFYVETCNNNEVFVTIDDTTYDQYEIDYESDGTPDLTINQGDPIPAFQYPSSASYNLSVTGLFLNAADNCTPNTTTVVSIPVVSSTDITAITTIDGQSIQTEYQPLPNASLFLEYKPAGSGTFLSIQKLDNSGTFLFNDPLLDTHSTSYCFRVATMDPCNNQYYYSETVCSINTALDIQDRVNSLSWNVQTNMSGYTVCKDGNCNISLATTTYDDTNIICNINYCYTITGLHNSGTTISSNEVCGVAFSLETPPPVQNIVIQVNESNTFVEWLPATGYTPSEFYLKTKYNSIISSTVLTENQYTEISDELLNEQCYAVSFTDVCGNSSVDGNYVCPIIVDAIVLTDNSISIEWNSYSGYLSGISGYEIEKYDQNGVLLATFNSTESNYLDTSNPYDHQVVYYRVYASPSDASLNKAYSKLVKVRRKVILSKPQAFTPNNDGLNDTFLISGSFIANFEFKLYNRWGELIYSNNDITNGWDGTYNGKLMPAGTYAWIASIEDMSGESINFRGHVALIRN